MNWRKVKAGCAGQGCSENKAGTEEERACTPAMSLESLIKSGLKATPVFPGKCAALLLT